MSNKVNSTIDIDIESPEEVIALSFIASLRIAVRDGILSMEQAQLIAERASNIEDEIFRKGEFLVEIAPKEAPLNG